MKNKLINLDKYYDNYLTPLYVILFSCNSKNKIINLVNLDKAFPNYLT